MSKKWKQKKFATVNKKDRIKKEKNIVFMVCMAFLDVNNIPLNV